MIVRAIVNHRIAMAGPVCLALSLATAPGAASAQATEAGNVDYLENVKTCRSIAEPDARLACYDAAIGQMIAATESGDLQIIDQEDIRETRRGLFGFSIPKIKLFGGSDTESDELLQTTISSARRSGRSGYILTTAEGAVWEIKSAPSRLRPPAPGQTVIFKRASLGSFFIRIDGQTGVKGKRVE